MTEDTKVEMPTQLPTITFRVASPAKTAPDMYEFAEIEVPIRWEDFQGTTKVKGIAKAGINIARAIREEMKADYESRQELVKEEEAKAEERRIAKKQEDDKARVAKYIEEHPDKVEAQRKELGYDVISDEAAAMILIKQEEFAKSPPKKPSFSKTTSTTQTAASVSIDTSNFPASVIDGKQIRFYKSEYGWSCYPYHGATEDAEKNGITVAVFDWLISIPMELRHRRTSKYPMVTKNGNSIMLNDYEKDFITQAAKAHGIEVEIKED